MSELLLPLNGDVGPNEYVPTPPGLHFQNVDELVNDGDTSYLSASTAGDREVFSIDASVLTDDDVITSMVIRTTWKPGANFGSWKSGFIIGGVDYLTSSHSDGGGSPYVTTDDTWTTNPATGMPWTKAALAAAYVVHEQQVFSAGLPRPRLTQCAPIANIVDPPARPTGPGDAVTLASTGTVITPSSTAAAGTVAGSPASVAAGAVVGATPTPLTSPVAIVGSAIATATGRTGPPTDPGKPTASGAPTGPTATVGRQGPTATPSIIVRITGVPL